MWYSYTVTCTLSLEQISWKSKQAMWVKTSPLTWEHLDVLMFAESHQVNICTFVATLEYSFVTSRTIITNCGTHMQQHVL